MPSPSVWRFIGVETGPLQVEVEKGPKGFKNQKQKKREMWHKSRRTRLGGPSRWSRS